MGATWLRTTKRLQRHLGMRRGEFSSAPKGDFRIGEQSRPLTSLYVGLYQKRACKPPRSMASPARHSSLSRVISEPYVSLSLSVQGPRSCLRAAALVRLRRWASSVTLQLSGGTLTMDALSLINAEKLFGTLGIVASVIAASIAAIGAVYTGRLKNLKFGGFEIESGITPEAIAAYAARQTGSTEEKPFEVVALSNYYNHALLRANVSFWFSLVFAAIGFGVIIFAFATHDRGDLWGTVVKAASGTVIDAVSTLIFVQSTNAQKSMSEFFEKLRLDRLNAEARGLIGEIANSERADQLRAQLVLKYAGIDRLLEGGSAPASAA